MHIVGYIVILSVLGCCKAQTSSSSTTTRRPVTEYNPPYTWSKTEIPNPQVDVYKCGRSGKPSFVCDPNRILSESDADLLDELIYDIRHYTGNCMCDTELYYCPSDPQYGGFHAAIVVLQDIEVPSDSASDIRKGVGADYAEYLRDRAWSFGRCDDDIVIIVSVDDKLVYTRTGHSARQYLSDSCADVIFDENKDYFRTGMYGVGLVQIMESYKSVFQGDRSCRAPLSSGAIAGIVIGVMAFLGILGGILCCCCGCCKGGGGGGGGSSSWGRSMSFGGGGSSWGGGGGSSGGGGGTWD